MERITAQLTDNVRRETIAGRTYLVAPVSMIVPGVLNGSKGSLMYPHDEVAKNPGVWNNVPITHGHPYGKNNEAVSARDPSTLDKFQLGAVFNDRFENGKRVAEGWFDEQLTKTKAPEVYAALNSGSPMEVSTGLFTDDEPAQNGASHNGTAYQFVARNYRPDHLAVLPNQRGACSNQDGCGLNVNTFCSTGPGGGQDNSCGKEGSRGPEKSNSPTPTGQKFDSRNSMNIKAGAIKSGQMVSHGGAYYVAKGPAKDGLLPVEGGHIRVGKLVTISMNAAPNQPKSQNTGKYKQLNAGTGKGETHQAAQDGWHGGPKCDCPEGVACNCNLKSNSKRKRGPKMNREQGVQWLTTNCDCHKGKDAVLANADNYTDAEIAALVENEQRAQTNQLVVNQFVQAVPGVNGVAINEIPAFIKKKMGGEEEEAEPADPEAELAAEEEEEKAVENKKKAITANEYLAQMPESLRPVWEDMVANANDRRNELLGELNKIVKNERDPQRRAIVETKLKGRMTNNELKELIALIKPTANASRVAPAPTPTPAPHYWGSQGGSTPTDNAAVPTADLQLELPRIDWSEMASPAINGKRK